MSIRCFPQKATPFSWTFGRETRGGAACGPHARGTGCVGRGWGFCGEPEAVRYLLSLNATAKRRLQIFPSWKLRKLPPFVIFGIWTWGCGLVFSNRRKVPPGLRTPTEGLCRVTLSLVALPQHIRSTYWCILQTPNRKQNEKHEDWVTESLEPRNSPYEELPSQVSCRVVFIILGISLFSLAEGF